MGLGLIFMVMQFCLVADALQFHGSADYASSPMAIPPDSIRKRNEDSGSHIAAAPSIVFHKHHRGSSRIAGSKSFIYPPSTYRSRGPLASPFRPHRGQHSPMPAPSPSISSSYGPTIAPSGSAAEKKMTPPLTIPPQPRNEGCASITCTEPLTNAPSGSPCGCVLPIQVELQLGVELYTFFPLVSELEKDIAASITLNHSQVRIMGADSATLEETTVLINLIPRGAKFDYSTALGIYRKFWQKQITVNESLFGDYRVLYVNYPGLPPSAPSSVSDSGGHDSGQAVKPLGVDVPKRKQHVGLRRNMIVVVVLSSFVALFVCSVLAWMLVTRFRRRVRQPDDYSVSTKPSAHTKVWILLGDPYCVADKVKVVAPRRTVERSVPNSASASFRSTDMAYLGAAKVLNLDDVERATNHFDASRILGEGGFGVVYSGTLGGGHEVAVKVLKRQDQHGSREFLAEIEMLSRLHHRNLVKLIGICTDERVRCLVYELIPNGSVESHLHGRDKDRCPLDWVARMKIALDTARGLAYLHEDSNPRVIHRDFKASNILLEHDFTPKLSDFGLARAALDEGNTQISTQVMGTFGYLAPEYAMTGHLLVKSDVYSYGVVLLELLTGRKPVDLSQPPGQENLVAWARPLLTSKEGLETIVDRSIQSSKDRSFDSLAKVAAIASMCVQPEASHRPFMGEVVQALKLVCSEFDEPKETSHCEVLKDDPVSNNRVPGYDSDPDTRVGLSSLYAFGGNVGVRDEEFWLFSRGFRSGPLGMGKRKKFWQRLKSLSKGSTSEHEFSLKFWPGSD